MSWQGCTLVNSLCPDDLCVLPKAHDGEHQLGTMVEPGPLSACLIMAPERAKGDWSEQWLITLGQWLQDFCVGCAEEAGEYP